MSSKDRIATVGEIIRLAVGYLAVSLLTVGVYLLIDRFSYRVVTGLALGSGVMMINFIMLAVAVNRAVDNIMEKRGDGEMSEEEAAAFAEENATAVRAAAAGSYIFRTLIMIGSLLCAFLLSSWFDVIATAIPLLTYRPIIYVSEIFRKRRDKA